jgi:DNA-binding GntR family transcriptional regulator
MASHAEAAVEAPALRPIETATLQDQVYREIKRQIMSGAYKPGQTLSMQTVADALHTSTMPVREAMRRLTAEHAVEIRPKRAIRIPLMSRSRFSEIADIRVALEGLAAAYAARNITAAEIAALERILAASERAREAADVRGYLAQNQAFHFTIYGAARSLILLPIIETLWVQTGPVLGLYTEQGLEIGAEYHGLVIRRLRARDGRGARTALVKDIGIGMQHFLDTATFDAD